MSESSYMTAPVMCATEGYIRIFFRCLTLVLLMTVFQFVSISASAEGMYSSEKVNFSIPRQRADQALIEFANQADMTFIFPIDEAQEKFANQLIGTYTRTEAIRMLLEGTGLQPEFHSDGALTVKSDHRLKVEGKTMQSPKRGVLASLIAFLFVAGETSAASLPEERGPRVIEEIIVTAQKRENSAQLLPVSLTAISGESMRKAGITSAQDLSGISPSLNATLGNGQLQLTMRGVGNELVLSGVGESGVAFHSNGIYLGSNITPTFGFFDLERIEIMRGPQGTLWGRNSTGGAINVIQNRPSQVFEGYLDLSNGNYGSKSIEGAISGPVTDKVSARLAVNYRNADGYIDNLAAGGGDDFGGEDDFSARFSIEFTFGDTGSWLLATGYGDRDINGHALKQEGTAFPVGTINPIAGTPGGLSFQEAAFGVTAERGELETYGIIKDARETLQLHYFTSELSTDFLGSNLTFITDYREHERESLADNGFTPTAISELRTLYSEDVDEFSQEIRLASISSGDLEWLVGVFYYQQNIDVSTAVGWGPWPGVPDVLFGGAFGPDYPQVSLLLGGDLKVKSLGLFGQSTYRINDKWTTTLGLRYSRDDKTGSEFNTFRLGAQDGIPLQQLTGTFDKNWSEWTGKLGFEYSLANNTFAFANFSTGYKSGGVNLGGFTGAFDPETIASYEVGIKSTLWDRRLRLNTTAFYSDFKDYQLQSVDGPSVIITNADAEIYGLEVEVDLIPADTWLINFVAAWNHSEVTEYAQPGLLNPATFSPVSAGEPLPRTPEFSYQVGVEKNIYSSNQSELTARLSYTWQDDVNLDAFATFGADEDAYGLLDASVSLTEISGKWSVDLYGKNLTDEYYKTSSLFYAAVLGSGLQAQIGKPRTYGIRFRYNFD